MQINMHLNTINSQVLLTDYLSNNRHHRCDENRKRARGLQLAFAPGAGRCRGRALGASGLAREFNARSERKLKVTLHAARKWLVGDAIPAQARIRVLADWLGVSTEWLRFGLAPAGKPAQALAAPDAQRLLVDDVARLSTRQFQLVRELVTLLLTRDELARTDDCIEPAEQ